MLFQIEILEQVIGIIIKDILTIFMMIILIITSIISGFIGCSIGVYIIKKCVNTNDSYNGIINTRDSIKLNKMRLNKK